MSDWDKPLVLTKKVTNKSNPAAVNALRRQGVDVDVEKKCALKFYVTSLLIFYLDAAASNKVVKTDKNLAKLDRESEELSRKSMKVFIELNT